MREEEERRSRAWEPPGASLWRLEELQEPRKGLSGEGVDEHRGGGGHAYTSPSCLWLPPSFLHSSSPPVPQPQPIPARAECLLRGAGGRGRHSGRVKELSASFCREVQQVERWGGLKLGGGGACGRRRKG